MSHEFTPSPSNSTSASHRSMQEQQRLYESDSEEDVEVEDAVSSVSTTGRRRGDDGMVDSSREGETVSAVAEGTQRTKLSMSSGSETNNKEPMLLDAELSSDSLSARFIKRKNIEECVNERDETERENKLLMEQPEYAVSASLSRSPTHSNTPVAASEPPKKRRRGRPRKHPPSKEEENVSAPHTPARSEILLRRRGRRPHYKEQDSDSGEESEPGFMLSEYQWSVGGAVEWFMLQEHVAEFLDIRGMQRRYPGEETSGCVIQYIHTRDPQ